MLYPNYKKVQAVNRAFERLAKDVPRLPNKELTPETEAINNEFENMSHALNYFRRTCEKNKRPICSVTYRVLDTGEIRCHVTYKKK